MEPLGIWHAPVQGYAEIVDDPQIRHMRALTTVAGEGDRHAPITVVNHPVLYDGKRAEVRLPPQRLGAQTGEILKEIGLSEPEIAALARDKVIALAEPGPAQG
jgi:crotonobetainyl-CoA:carnitine CoA-transferase CaiB-like acyl-CoA transferase